MQSRDDGVQTRIELPSDFAMLTAGPFVVTDRSVLSLEYHDVLELGHCRQGSGVFVGGGRVLPFSEGDVSIIVPGELHLAQSQRGTTSTWMFLFLDFDSPVLKHFPELVGFDIQAFAGGALPHVISSREDGSLARTVRALVEEAVGRRRYYRTMILAQLAALAALLERDYAGWSARTASQAAAEALLRVRMALEYVARHYDEPIDTASLAAACGMGTRAFSRHFAQALKLTPRAYVARTRIAVARSLLAGSASPIASVARQSGFRSISAFTRMFCRSMGMPARTWRRRHAANHGTAQGD